ncbi:MAG: N-acetyl-gamma-glutamyl-phosphate reductase, partial [Phycisphaerales bacterium]|nr:N-acetyl-gamma-glutamyl-phosphate reductase [Phycisphaerales bacterium]
AAGGRTCMIRASIVGGTGYTGGELLRLLLDHPEAEVVQVTSRSSVGRFVHGDHPNLRSRTSLKYVLPDAIEPCDVLFLCMPHGEASGQIEALSSKAERIIDLSADFRLRDPEAYATWYGAPHAQPTWLDRFTYGLPETNRASIQSARYVSGVGCNATAMNLALLPLAREGLIERAVADLKVGSSEGGASAGPASHHPERSGCIRSFAPGGHRHQAEVEQELGSFSLDVSVTSVELVRGVLCTAHVFPTRPLETKDLWALLRTHYADEPFVRLVKDRMGIHRFPDPKILAGSNWADVGFEIDERSGRVIMISAIDNLMKGAAGTAVQCMNLMHGLDETTGLTFPGLHPI